MAIDENKVYITLEEDIYCIGFRTFLRTTNARQLDRIVLKCIFTFLFQVMVVGLMMMNQLNLQTDGDFGMDSLISESSVVVGKPTLNMTRLCCCFLLHISILPELTSAKEMLQFAKLNPTAFTGQRFEYAMMFASFKLTGGMLCFFANCLIMLKSETIEDVIKDYIAVEIISNIDNLMAATVTGDDVVPEMAVYMTLDRYNKTDGELLEDYIFDILPEAKKRDVVKEEAPNGTLDKRTTWKDMDVLEAVVDGNFEERFPWN